MPSYETHCEETRRLLGDEFGEVHRWLDELFVTRGPLHHKFRHNLAGIAEVRRRWGDRAAEAAKCHIAADLRYQGWVEGRDPLPADEADFVKMGLV